MNSTSYVKVYKSQVANACRNFLLTRQSRIKNKIQREIEQAMLVNSAPWWKKIFGIHESRTYDEAYEYVYNRNEEWYILSISETIENTGLKLANRVEMIENACHVESTGYIFLSIEDNNTLKGWYD